MYDAGRPDYPNRVYDILNKRCRLVPGVTVLECGPGTGQATRRLIDAGARVTAIEPDPGMARYLQDSFRDRELEVVAATFENVELPDSGFDLAVAATSFHWVDPKIGIPKLRRIVRPDGWVAIWWTIFGDPDRGDPFGDAVSEVLGYNQAGTWREQLDAALDFPNVLRKHGFLDVTSERIDWKCRMNAQDVRAFYASITAVLLRPEPDQQRVLDSLQEIIQDRFDGIVERSFVTIICTGRRA